MARYSKNHCAERNGGPKRARNAKGLVATAYRSFTEPDHDSVSSARSGRRSGLVRVGAPADSVKRHSMTRSERLLSIVSFLFMAASCSRRPDEDRARTAAAQRSAHEQNEKAHNDTMDLAGAPRNEAGSPDRPRKKGESP